MYTLYDQYMVFPVIVAIVAGSVVGGGGLVKGIKKWWNKPNPDYNWFYMDGTYKPYSDDHKRVITDAFNRGRKQVVLQTCNRRI